MSLILTRNNLCELNVFFYKNSFNNIHRPDISYLQIENHKTAEPAFHIGFSENMGYLDSVAVTAGAMVFEVLEGYPLQSLLFFYNEETRVDSDGRYSPLKYRLEDLEPMDFYCIQNQGLDPYGDFILRDVKFTSTKMEQGIENPGGRKLVAQFICKEMRPFKIPYFYNYFKSDDYNYHIIRNKKEIDEIVKDIESVRNEWNEMHLHLFIEALDISTLNVTESSTKDLGDNLGTYVRKKFQQFVDAYKSSASKPIYSYQPLKDLQAFIKVFYTFKNALALEELKEDTKLEFLRYIEND
jgi:hypothetical protein